jgi:hypothetical protein
MEKKLRIPVKRNMENSTFKTIKIVEKTFAMIVVVS